MTATFESNPYAPPGVDDQPRVELARNQWGQLQIGVESVLRSWTARQLFLSGSIAAVIRYESTGAGESVYVNDQMAAKTPFFHWHGSLLNAVNDHVDFHLPYDSYFVPACIDVYVSAFQLLRITRFRLTVCEQVVYDESRRPR